MWVMYVKEKQISLDEAARISTSVELDEALAFSNDLMEIKRQQKLEYPPFQNATGDILPEHGIAK
jgi:hypothetical protein